MSLSDFEIHQKLGSGAYSTVYKCLRKDDQKEYAMKQVDINDLSFKEKQNALNEVRILASISNENIIAYKDAFFDEPSGMLCIIMEYADGGDIFTLIKDHQKKSQIIDEDLIWKIFIQCVRGLKCLHEMKIMHRDLKCANIFLTKDFTAKLGDLNVSKVMKKEMSKTQTGTPYYASPEVWKDELYDWRSDIWSLGCVLYEMITLKPPFRAQNMEGLYKKVLRGVYPKINQQTYSEDISAVVKSLLQVNPDLRPSCQEILEFPEVMQYADELCPDNNIIIPKHKQIDLLRTIRMPKKLHFLAGRLPKSQYKKMNFAIKEETLDQESLNQFLLSPDNKKQTFLSANVYQHENSISALKPDQNVNRSLVQQNNNQLLPIKKVSQVNQQHLQVHQDSLVNINSSQNVITTQDTEELRKANTNDTDDASLKKKRKRRIASKIYGALDRELLDKQSTKHTTQDNEGSEIIRLKSNQGSLLNHQISPRSLNNIPQSEIKEAIQKQRSIIVELSKNLQNDIFMKRSDGEASPNVHVLQRFRDKDGQNEELQKFQKIANIYGRHIYIKNQIEQTKKELQEDLNNEQSDKNKRLAMSVPRQRPTAKSSLLPSIEPVSKQSLSILQQPAKKDSGYIENYELMDFYKKSVLRNNAVTIGNYDSQIPNSYHQQSQLSINPRLVQRDLDGRHGRNINHQIYSIQNSPTRGTQEMIQDFQPSILPGNIQIHNPRIENQIISQRLLQAQQANRSVLGTYRNSSINNSLILGYHQQPPPLIMNQRSPHAVFQNKVQVQGSRGPSPNYNNINMNNQFATPNLGISPMSNQYSPYGFNGRMH
eukprot:403372003